MTDTIKLLNERAASYGALRKSSLTAVAMDCAAVELAALESELGERVQELAAAHATIHQLGENAAKAAGEYAERVAVLEGALSNVRAWAASLTVCDMNEIIADGGLTAGMFVGQEAGEQVRRIDRALNRAALTEPTDG